MDNTKSDIDLIELIIIDVIFTLIFVLVMFLAVLCPARHYVAINFTLVFGVVTLPFAHVFGKWMNFLRYHENIKLASWLKMDSYSGSFVFWDLGQQGYSWMFRVFSSVTVIASLYHLLRYMFG